MIIDFVVQNSLCLPEDPKRKGNFQTEFCSLTISIPKSSSYFGKVVCENMKWSGMYTNSEKQYDFPYQLEQYFA